MPDTMQQPVRDWQADWEMCERATPGPYGYDFIQYPGPNGQVEEYTIITPSGVLREAEAFLCSEAREALPYWLEEYKKKAECYSELARIISGQNCDYHYWKSRYYVVNAERAKEEQRADSLLDLIKTVSEEISWKNQGDGIDKALKLIYKWLEENRPSEQIRGEDDAGSNSRVQRDQEDPCTQEG